MRLTFMEHERTLNFWVLTLSEYSESEIQFYYLS